MNWRLRQAHAVVAWVFVVSIVVQVFLAGAAMTQLGGSGTFATHVDFGYTWVGLAGFAVLVTAIVARAGGRSILISLGLLALYIVQTSLPYARESIPAIAALHPVNAMVLFVLSIWYARRAWRTSSSAAAA
jgi:hypothetical protein